MTEGLCVKTVCHQFLVMYSSTSITTSYALIFLHMKVTSRSLIHQVSVHKIYISFHLAQYNSFIGCYYHSIVSNKSETKDHSFGLSTTYFNLWSTRVGPQLE